MRILYVYFHSYEDMPYHVWEWVEAAMDLGHDVRVLTAVAPSFLKKIGWDGRVDVKQMEHCGTGKLNHLRQAGKFRNAVTEELASGNYDLVYERFSTISSAVVDAVAPTEIKHCVEINGIIEHELALSGASWFRKRWFVQAQKKVYGSGARVVAVTENIRQWIIDSYGVPPDMVAAFANGVNTERFKPYPKDKSREKFSLPQDKFIMGFLGSLYPWCALDSLIRATAEFKDEENPPLFLIGGGQEPMRSNLQNLAKELDVDAMCAFPGAIPWEDAPEFIASFDVAVSLKKDGGDENVSFSPLKIYAYMACARPVLFAEVTGLRELVEHNVGLTVSSPASAEIAERIREFRTMNKTQLEQMGANGRKLVVERHSWEKVVGDTLEWLEK